MPIRGGGLHLSLGLPGPTEPQQPRRSPDEDLAVLLITGRGTDFENFARRVAEYARSIATPEMRAQAEATEPNAELAALEAELQRALGAVGSQRRRLASGG
jgi:hypothetical protein